MKTDVRCTKCKGYGYVYRKKQHHFCQKCDGWGYINKTKAKYLIV